MIAPETAREAPRQADIEDDDAVADAQRLFRAIDAEEPAQHVAQRSVGRTGHDGRGEHRRRRQDEREDHQSRQPRPVALEPFRFQTRCKRP
jgi:hypothetical protein